MDLLLVCYLGGKTVHYKIVDSGHIQAIGTGACPENGTVIDLAEFNELLTVMQGRPFPEAGYDYRLRTDLTWELVEAPAPDPGSEELTPEEALAIILGGDPV